MTKNDPVLTKSRGQGLPGSTKFQPHNQFPKSLPASRAYRKTRFYRLSRSHPRKRPSYASVSLPLPLGAHCVSAPACSACIERGPRREPGSSRCTSGGAFSSVRLVFRPLGIRPRNTLVHPLEWGLTSPGHPGYLVHREAWLWGGFPGGARRNRPKSGEPRCSREAVSPGKGRVSRDSTRCGRGDFVLGVNPKSWPTRWDGFRGDG